MNKEFKAPDLKAPRYRRSRILLLNSDLHKRFVQKFPEHKDTSNALFKDIIKTFHTNLYEGAVDNRDGVELLEGLGYLFVGTCPPKKKQNVDFVKSAKYGKQLSHINLESDNYLAKIFYTNFASKYKFKDREVWKFTAYRKFSRLVGKTYPERWKMYVQVENHQMISKLFMKGITRNVVNKLNQRPVEDTYNEFDMN